MEHESQRRPRPPGGWVLGAIVVALAGCGTLDDGALSAEEGIGRVELSVGELQMSDFASAAFDVRVYYESTPGSGTFTPSHYEAVTTGTISDGGFLRIVPCLSGAAERLAKLEVSLVSVQNQAGASLSLDQAMPLLQVRYFTCTRDRADRVHIEFMLSQSGSIGLGHVVVELRSHRLSASASCPDDLLPATDPSTGTPLTDANGGLRRIQTAVLSLASSPTSSKMVLLGTGMEHPAAPVFLADTSSGTGSIDAGGSTTRWLSHLQPTPDLAFVTPGDQTDDATFAMSAVGFITGGTAGEFVGSAPYFAFSITQQAGDYSSCAAAVTVGTALAQGAFDVSTQPGTTTEERSVFLVLNDDVPTSPPATIRQGIKIHHASDAVINSAANVTVGAAEQNTSTYWVDADGNDSGVFRPLHVAGTIAYTHSASSPSAFAIVVQGATNTASLGEIHCTANGTLSCTTNADGSARLYTEGSL